MRVWIHTGLAVALWCSTASVEGASLTTPTARGDSRDALVRLQADAERGVAEAQWRLGNLIARGAGIERDRRLARVWIERAADQGHAAAEFHLNRVADDDSRLPHTFEQRADWFRGSAHAGDAIAQFRMGALYEEGIGVKRDLIEAYVWFGLAAAQGHELARAGREYCALRMKSRHRLKAERQLQRELGIDP